MNLLQALCLLYKNYTTLALLNLYITFYSVYITRKGMGSSREGGREINNMFRNPI